MTVLINGMEMPNRCFEYIFLTKVPNFFCLAGKRDLCAEHGINISRPDWCPLIEVQSPHGRLIDASTRVTTGTQRGFGLRVVTVDTLIDEHAVRNVPTIIEGDETNDA